MKNSFPLNTKKKKKKIPFLKFLRLQQIRDQDEMH